MAHNLNFNESLKRHAFFSRKEVAWHGLGIVVDNALTSEEAIVMAGLNYPVFKGKNYVKYEFPIKSKAGELTPNSFATYRGDTGVVFGNVGTRYEVIQNTEAFNFFDEIVGSKEAIFETAGALGNGEEIFITAKLPDNIKLGEDDIIDKYLLLRSSHNGSCPIQAMFTPIRVVCNNTLRLALSRSTNKINIKHTKNAHQRLKIGAELMGLSNKYFDTFKNYMEYNKHILINRTDCNKVIAKSILNPNEYDLFIQDGFRATNISQTKLNKLVDIVDSIESGAGQDKYRGTKLWVINGVSTYINNSASYNDSTDKFKSVFDGDGNKLLNNVMTNLELL